MRNRRYDERSQLTQAEVARRLGLTRRYVAEAEARALQKLWRHPVIRRLARELGILGDRA